MKSMDSKKTDSMGFFDNGIITVHYNKDQLKL